MWILDRGFVQDLWDLLKVNPDHFARTTPAKHKDNAKEIACR